MPDTSLHFPDYRGGGIVNLMSSLATALGAGESAYPPTPLLPPAALAARRNIVLMVIDGLGDAFLARTPGGDTLRRYRQGRLTSVFPSTTATAVTTYLTGAAPQQHGLTGWFTYFKEIGGVIAVLPFRPRLGGAPLTAAGVSPAALFGLTPLFDRIAVPSYAVSPQAIVDSDFNTALSGRARRIGYRTLAEYFAAIKQIIQENDARKYIYAYFPDIDALAHEHGIASRQAAETLTALDTAFAAFLTAIRGSDTAVILCADHGLIDTTPERRLRLADHPRLEETLVLPLCGEPRAAYCYVHPEKRRQFEDYARTELAHCAVLFDSGQLAAAARFGQGRPHPRLLERIGHYTLVMRENYTLKDQLLGERPHPHIGVHGGASAEEMYVPLIVATV